MTTFTLDTSGNVRLRGQYPNGQTHDVTFWSDLSPFVQGYIEAALSSSYDALFDEWWERHDSFTREKGLRFAFSDLAPEALAQMIADCEAWLAKYPPGEEFSPPNHARADGAYFWKERNQGLYDGFPPLTPYFGDDGKVYLREATS